MKLWKCLIAPLALFALGEAQAQTAVQSPNRLTGGLLLQDTSYETSDNFDVEGNLLVVGYKAALNNKFSLGGGLGLMFDGEIGNGPKVGDGNGFRLFGEGQFDFAQKGATTFSGTFALIHDQFKFSENDLDVDFSITEIKIGGLAIHRIREFSLYGGLEVILYSNGSLESSAYGISYEADAERDDRLNLRLGAAFAIDRALDIRADLLLLGEQTILFGVDYKI